MIIASAYINTNVPHTNKIFQSSGDYYSCRQCHQGFPNEGATATNFIFEGYRCLACHYSISSTHNLTNTTENSIHRSLLCTNCHDVTHAGHTKQMGYYTVSPSQELYGCYGSRCHQVVADRLNPPASQSFTRWVNSYHSNVTAYITWQIINSLWIININDQYRIYPYTFINPYNGDLTTPTQNNLYKACLKCHFTNPGSEQTGTTSYSNTHTDVCYQCHAYNLSNNPYNMAPHSITETSNGTGIYCSRCHTSVASEVANSIHSGLQCSNCHATLHIAGFNQTASWLTIYYPESGPINVPTITQVLEGRRIFLYTTDNSSVYNLPVRPVNTGGGYTLVLPVYTLRWDASPIIQYNNNNITCFNCHFVGWYDPVVAAYNSGWNMSGFSDPHSIKGSLNVAQIELPSERTDRLPGLLIAIMIIITFLSMMVINYAKNRTNTIN